MNPHGALGASAAVRQAARSTAAAVTFIAAQAAAHAQTARPAITPPPPEAPRKLDIGTGAYLWYAQPLDKGDSKVEVFFAYVALDASHGRFGLRLEPRFRDSKLRENFASNIWLQEAYGYADLGAWGRLKFGKTYARFGLYWDGTFANLQYFDGTKLVPDNGLSYEGQVTPRAAIAARWALQYFPLDGGTNGALAGRDTITIPGAHRRHELVARLEPTISLATWVSLTMGASVETFRADFVQGPDDRVNRAEIDATLALGAWGRALIEGARQWGRSVDAQVGAAAPAPAAAGFASERVDRMLACLEGQWRGFTARAAFSAARYDDADATELFWHPGLAFLASPYVTLMTEWIYWRRRDPAGARTLSNGLHLIVYLHF